MMGAWEGGVARGRRRPGGGGRGGGGLGLGLGGGIFLYGGNYTKYFVFVNWGGFFGGGRFSALAGVDRSGRGFNPRPALLPTGTPQPALPDRHSTSGIRYFRIWNCRETFGRGGAFRPCAGRGLYPRPERSTPAKYLPCFQIRKNIAAINLSNCFLLSVALLSRGWIVPVGGATPDRHKDQGRRKEAALGRAGLVFSELLHSGFRQGFLGGANFWRVFAAEFFEPVVDVVIQNFAEEFDVTLRGV